MTGLSRYRGESTAHTIHLMSYIDLRLKKPMRGQSSECATSDNAQPRRLSDSHAIYPMGYFPWHVPWYAIVFHETSHDVPWHPVARPPVSLGIPPIAATHPTQLPVRFSMAHRGTSQSVPWQGTALAMKLFVRHCCPTRQIPCVYGKCHGSAKMCRGKHL